MVSFKIIATISLVTTVCVHACMCVCVCEGPRRGAVGPEACVHIQGHIQRSHPGLGKAEGVAATWSLGLASGGRWGAAAANTSEAGRAEMLSRRVYFSKPRGCLLMASQRAGTCSPPPPPPAPSLGPLGCPEHRGS